tara:strand:+ start:214 stop:762 length:549 start_codon:yes stop_codon:yes gene_type:complete
MVKGSRKKRKSLRGGSEATAEYVPGGNVKVCFPVGVVGDLPYPTPQVVEASAKEAAKAEYYRGVEEGKKARAAATRSTGTGQQEGTVETGLQSEADTETATGQSQGADAQTRGSSDQTTSQQQRVEEEQQGQQERESGGGSKQRKSRRKTKRSNKSRKVKRTKRFRKSFRKSKKSKKRTKRH